MLILKKNQIYPKCFKTGGNNHTVLLHVKTSKLKFVEICNIIIDSDKKNEEKKNQIESYLKEENVSKFFKKKYFNDKLIIFFLV